MKLNDELEYLEQGVVTNDEIKAYCKLKGILAFHEDNADDASVCADELKKLNAPKNVAPTDGQSNSNKKSITDSDVKNAIDKLKNDATRSGEITTDDVINVIDPSQISNQQLRDMVQGVLNNKQLL